MLWSFKIWKKKTVQVFEDGELIEVAHPTDTDWYKIDFALELDEIRITSFEDAEIYVNESKCKKCTKVYFSDDDWRYAAFTLDSFKKLYEAEYIKIVLQAIKDAGNLEGGDQSA